MLETITQPMVEPEHGTRRDMEAYQAYKHKDRVARIMMLSSMRNDLMLSIESNRTTMAVWDAVKVHFSGTSTTRLRQLTLKFDAYKKQSNHTMNVMPLLPSNL